MSTLSSPREDDSQADAVRVLPYKAEHAAEVRTLISGIQRNEFDIPIALEDQPDLFDVERVYCSHRQGGGVGEFWVAVHARKVVGTLALFDLGNGLAALRKMFVAAPFRGAPHRTGQLLLDTLLAHARVEGVREVALGTAQALHAAHRFYERNGFVQIRKETLPANWPHNSVDVKFYRRKL